MHQHSSRKESTLAHVRAVPSSSNRSDGFGIDAQVALRLHRIEDLKACSLPEVYQYSSLKKDAKSCVMRQPLRPVSRSIGDGGCSGKVSCHVSGSPEPLPGHKTPCFPLSYSSIHREPHFSLPGK